mgnify:CR=1 FL=1|tara:strand:- start:529 stop:1176 length:648 start_codon:yes stop_codon:yes gene_type:complete
MAYGLVAYTGNSTLIIDGSSSSYKSFQIITQSTANSTQQNISLNAGELLFVRRSTTGSILASIGSSGGQVFGATDYVIVKQADDFSTITSGYGLIVYNQGGDIAYQSVAANKGLSIQRVFPEGGLTGVRQGWTSGPGLTSGDFVLESTNPSSYYVLLNGAYASAGNINPIRINGYYYDYGNTRISYIGYYSFNSFVSGSGPIVSQQTALVAQVIG